MANKTRKKKAPKKAKAKRASKKAPKKAPKRLAKATGAKRGAKAARAAQPAKRPKPARKRPIKRRDATGHLDPSYARDLRRASRENEVKDDDRAFLVGKAKDDALAEEMGREFVETVTSGEDEGNEVRDAFVTEEVGGPFVTTTRGQEIDDKPDASNPEGSTREPFPKSN